MNLSRLRLFVCLLALTAALNACGKDVTVDIDVRIVSDLIPEYEAASVTIDLYEGNSTAGTTGAQTVERALRYEESLLRGLFVASFDGVTPGTYTVRAALRRTSGAILVERPLTVTVAENTAVTVTLSADCVNVECPNVGGDASLSACLGGQCVDPRCSAETPEHCPAIDGLFCDSDNQCAPPNGCSEASCVGRSCLRESAEGACGDGAYCSPLDGCVSLPGADAGTDDAGTHDAGAFDASTEDASVAIDAATDMNVAVDASVDAAIDAGVAIDADVAIDAGVDAAIDAATDMNAAVDAAPDAALDLSTPCPDGFTGTVEVGCVDIDECALGRDACTGDEHCANTPGAYECFGLSDVVLGNSHTCALFANGDVKCWGINSNGQLGYGHTVERRAPVGEVLDFGAGRKVSQLAAGGSHTCAILDDGSVKCWGINGSGQLGYGDVVQRNAPSDAPIALGEGRTATALALSSAHTCALLDDDSVKCWGLGASGRLGYGDTSDRLAPPDATLDFGEHGDGTPRRALTIGAGQTHTCALLDDGFISCWGQNDRAQLGTGDAFERSTPTPIVLPGGVATTHLAVTGWGACTFLDAESLTCWGWNMFGQLGYGDLGSRSTAPSTYLDFGGTAVTELSPGNAHMCALLGDGTVRCWGYNGLGQLGYDDLSNRLSPPPTGVALSGLVAKHVYARSHSTCVVFDDDSMKCWGANGNGQLGYGDTMDRLSPPSTTIDLRGR